MLLGGVGGTHILLVSGVVAVASGAVAAGVLELDNSRCARLPIKRERGSWLQIREVLARAPNQRALFDRLKENRSVPDSIISAEFSR